MKILHRYILGQFLRNLIFAVVILTALITLVDFFDRIDNVAAEDSSLSTAVLYFILKIPYHLSLMLPTAVLVTTLFTFGILSKNSEIAAMRASGLKLLWLVRPVFLAGLVISLLALLLNETIVPYAQRRSHELYNLDIRKKNLTGQYSQQNFWWRNGNRFFNFDQFDSRTNTMSGFTSFELSNSFQMTHRLDSDSVRWVSPQFGWTMYKVLEYSFKNSGNIEVKKLSKLALPIGEKPEYFYDVELEIESMSYRSLRKYIKKLTNDGISAGSYLADLHAKLAFPFVNLICILTALPFALRTARAGNLGRGFLAGIIVGFSYYVVHSLSISLGRAEIIPPLAAAWTANILLGLIGLVLNWGAEAP